MPSNDPSKHKKSQKSKSVSPAMSHAASKESPRTAQNLNKSSAVETPHSMPQNIQIVQEGSQSFAQQESVPDQISQPTLNEATHIPMEEIESEESSMASAKIPMEEEISTFFEPQPDLQEQQEKLLLIKRRLKLKRQVAAYNERKALINQGRYVAQKEKPEHCQKLDWISHYLDEWTRTTLHGRFKKEIEEQEAIAQKALDEKQRKLVKE